MAIINAHYPHTHSGTPVNIADDNSGKPDGYTLANYAPSALKDPTELDGNGKTIVTIDASVWYFTQSKCVYTTARCGFLIEGELNKQMSEDDFNRLAEMAFVAHLFAVNAILQKGTELMLHMPRPLIPKLQDIKADLKDRFVV